MVYFGMVALSVCPKSCTSVRIHYFQPLPIEQVLAFTLSQQWHWSAKLCLNYTMLSISNRCSENILIFLQSIWLEVEKAEWESWKAVFFPNCNLNLTREVLAHLEVCWWCLGRQVGSETADRCTTGFLEGLLQAGCIILWCGQKCGRMEHWLLSGSSDLGNLIVGKACVRCGDKIQLIISLNGLFIYEVRRFKWKICFDKLTGFQNIGSEHS